MNPENSIEVYNVEKTFKVHLEASHQLKDAVIFRNRNKIQERHVLKSISFYVKKGEAVALIGKNGCGKSTMLKLLTRILRPDKGTINTQGRISSLIELGAGFHPDMTGRENVYINASIFGIKRREVDRRMEDIIRFSELEEYIDNPVRTYSSGMYMRLAFAVAINVDADILLIDEILAVGDAAFQEKCFEKLRSLKRKGVTIVIVSHAMGQIREICDRAIWMADGLVCEDGPADSVCAHYLEDMDEHRVARQSYEKAQLEQRTEKTALEKYQDSWTTPEKCRRIHESCEWDTRRSGNMQVRFTGIRLQNQKNINTLKFYTGDRMCLSFTYKLDPVVSQENRQTENEAGQEYDPVLQLTFSISDDTGLVYFSNTKQVGNPGSSEEEYEIDCQIDSLPLLSGMYYLNFRISDAAGETFDSIKKFLKIEVESVWRPESGLITIPHQWGNSAPALYTSSSKKPYDFLIVGAGLYGAVFARQALEAGKKCLVIEKRDHIAGNVFTEKIEGIDVHRYGAHIFHTNHKEIWKYVCRFGEFNRFTNSPLANYKGEYYNLPFNMNTFQKMWGISRPEEARKIIEQQRLEAHISEPQNLEEQAISLVGTDIYEKLVKGYTEKQWGRPCQELPPFIIRRLPVRFTYDNNYFNARYQGIPVEGYTKLVSSLLGNTEVRLGTDYLSDKEAFNMLADTVIYTGPIDAYFSYCLGELQYRSVRFENEILDMENYQGNAVVNYTDAQTPYTRIIEHKHFAFGQQPKTVISREYSSEWNRDQEPYYPVNDEKNNRLYQKYQALAASENHVVFGGRLGEYRYYDMDQVIEAALYKASVIIG